MQEENNVRGLSGAGPSFDEESGLPSFDRDSLPSTPSRWCEERQGHQGRLGSASDRKVAAILARLAALWARQGAGRGVSRLDGETIFTDAQWAALGDSALFAKPKDGGGNGNGGSGGAPCEFLPMSAPWRDAGESSSSDQTHGDAL